MDDFTVTNDGRIETITIEGDDGVIIVDTDSAAITSVGTQGPAGASASDATPTSKGVVQLAGDLSGTAAAPTVPALAGKYVKPGTGIPRTDLDSSAQTSLSKADTALQSAPVTSVAGRTGVITLAKGDVGLSNVDNTADADKPVSAAQATADGLRVSKSGDSMTGQLTFPADTFSIANPPIRFIYPDMTDDASSKGAVVEWGGVMQSATSYPYGIATGAYKANPAATFTVPSSGYKKWAWVTAHYDSPLSTGEDVHQHFNLETVKADWLTAITRFQISFGEDLALTSFPNTHVKFYPDLNVQVGSDAAGLYIKHDTGLARIVFAGDTPWNISGIGGIRLGSVGAPGGRMHVERADDGIMFYAKNTAAGGTATAQHLIEAVTSGSTSIATKVTGESVNRWSMNHSGRMEWGSGSLTRDTNLYRNAANELKTDDKLVAALGLDAGSQKVSNIADGTTTTDAASKGQMDIAITGAKARANHTGTQTASTVSDFSAATDARISVAVGATVQAHDSDLDAVAALSPTDDDLLQRKAGAWTSRTPAQVKADLALTKTDVGLANVDNTSDVNKPVSTAQAASIATKSTKGFAIAMAVAL